MARVVSSQLLARFPFGMMSLGFVMHIENMHKSYAIAGIALGAETIGAAISGPLLGRWLGKYGVRRVLITTAVAGALAMACLALFTLPAFAVFVLAFWVGLMSPPIQSAVRTVYPRLAKKEDLDSVFSLDATAQEIIWVVGPVLAAFIASTAGTAWVVGLMALIQVLGTTWFAFNPQISNLEIPRAVGRVGNVLKNERVYTNAIIGLLMVGSFSGVEVGAVAILSKADAGVALAALSAGSIIGGLFIANRVRSKNALSWFLSLVAVGYLLTFVNPTNAIWLGTAFFIAGLGIAPAFGRLSSMVASAIPVGDAAEAYGWINTGQLVGYSAAAALAGIAIDTVGDVSALLVALIFGLGAAIVAIISTKNPPRS
jgi:MFS family permease